MRHEMKKNWLFLYLKTGGGHLSPARALSGALTSKYGNDIEIQLIDGLDGAVKPAQWIIEGGYRTSINYAKWVFELLYAFNKIGFFHKLSNRMFSPVTENIIKKHIRKNKPDRIVIFHYFLIQPVYASLKDLDIHVPVTVVVTDPYTAHPIWFNDKRPDFIVFSEKLKVRLLKKGFLPGRIHQFPQIINPVFERTFETVEKENILQSHGLDSQRKTILIFGGGDGLKKGLPVLRKLLQIKAQANIMMVCGRNQIMENMARKMVVKSGRSHVKIFGFVDFMHELLSVSDIVVSKCGASALAEMLISQKIPVVVDYIWEQEKGNVGFLLDHELGIYEPRPARVVQRIEELLDQPKLFNRYLKNLERLDYKNGVHAIAEFLYNR